MFILDTNVVSELRKGGKADRNVVQWSATQEPETQFLSAITVFEIEIGILKLAAKDERGSTLLSNWLRNSLLAHFENRILPLDHACALHFAHLMHPRTRPYRDAMIAATAMAHGCTIVTRNIRDFQDLPLPLIDPWKPR
jgi:predicted nucleic acid-binding protein